MIIGTLPFVALIVLFAIFCGIVSSKGYRLDMYIKIVFNEGIVLSIVATGAIFIYTLGSFDMHTNEYSNNTLNSTWWYRNGSFLRLKNVELGYQFDKKLVQRWKMQNLRVYVQGSNLAVWDHVKMWDPEIGNSGARYPINATWTFGLDVTF